MPSLHAPDAPIAERGQEAARDARDTARQAAGSAQNRGRDTVNEPWFRLLARLGYAARGVVYLIIGALAALAAFGAGGGQTTDQQGAERAIYAQSWGKVLLVIIALGFIGMALWSFTQAWFNTEGKKRDLSGTVARVAFAGIGVTYAGLAIGTVKLLASGGRNSGKGSTTTAQDWTARLLNAPLGQALVVVVGLIVLAIAAILFVTAYRAKFDEHMAFDHAGARLRRAITWLGRVGYGALGVVFTEIGVFLIIAALHHNAGQAEGLAGALHATIQQAWGRWLLGLIAIGLIAYGFFSFAEARYHRMRPA